MSATRGRTNGTPCRDLWPRCGPEAGCSTCYRDALEYIARRVGGFGVSELWAEDIAEEALERTLAAFNPDHPSQSTAPFRSFLVAVAHNRARGHLRSEERRRNRGERWQIGEARILAVEQLDDLVADLDLVRHVIEQAHHTWGTRNPDIAQVCEMWLLGHDHATIAAEVGIHERTVRRHREIIDSWLRRKFSS